LPKAREVAEQLGFPLVVKPVDSQGKRGVSKVNHPAELELKFQNAIASSFCGCAILEEFFTGVEVSVEGFLSESHLTNLMIGDRYSFPFPDLFEPDQGMYPSLLGQELKQKILEVNAHFYENTGATFGITHAEYLVNEKAGEVRLVEGSIRGGGVYISSDMIPWVCGVDVNGPLIELATGKRASFRIDEAKAQERAAGYVCFYLPEGIIRRVEGVERVRALPGVHRLSLPELDSGIRTGRVGRDTIKQRAVVVTGEDRQACRETVRRIQQNLIVEVDTPTGVKGIQWGTPK
jgi:biotin carboxylase